MEVPEHMAWAPGVSLSRRRGTHLPNPCTEWSSLFRRSQLAIREPRPSPVPKVPNSPFSALLNSNGGQIGNDHLRGHRGCSEGKRQKGLSDGFQIVANFGHRKARRCPSPAALFSETAAAADRPVYHPRLPHMENALENRLQRRAEGCPRGRRVARMMKFHAAGLSIRTDRAGAANARKLA
jgi:hypothetical protein